MNAPVDNGDLRARLRTVESQCAVNDAAITRHEAVCAERYKAIHATVTGLGNRLTLISGMIGAGIVGELFGWKAGLVALVKLIVGAS